MTTDTAATTEDAIVQRFLFIREVAKNASTVWLAAEQDYSITRAECDELKYESNRAWVKVAAFSEQHRPIILAAIKDRRIGL